jgi:uncharacterized protein (TIGR02594 family)
MKAFTETEIAAFQSALNRDIAAGLNHDGEWGPKTQAAFEKWARISKVASPDTASARLYAHASKDLGMREVSGAASHPRIRLAINRAADWLDDDDSKTAWCGCIMGLWCSEIGLPSPNEYYRAAAWAGIGTETPIGIATKGDVCVFRREGGAHVALYTSHTDTSITVLGGNQSNAVTVATFPRQALKFIRRLA